VTPYYDEHAGITIYHGDCREVLPQLGKVDLVLTDPPYGIGEAAGKNASRGKMSQPVDYGNVGWDDVPVEQITMDAVVQHGEYAAVFGGNYYAMPPSSSWFVWDKENGKTDFADCELVWSNFGCAVRIIRHQWNGMLRVGREPRAHPTQKPLRVVQWVLSLCPAAPTTVLDPFMGSGTTLVAAKQLGRRAIGIELEERYCEIAAQRLSQEVFNFQGDM